MVLIEDDDSLINLIKNVALVGFTLKGLSEFEEEDWYLHHRPCCRVFQGHAQGTI